MIQFTSAREKRYWIAAAVVVALIYATLGLAQSLAEELRDQEWVSTAIWLGLWLIVAAIVVLGLKRRTGWAMIGVALGIVGVYVLVMARMGIPEERSHLIEYGIVAILVHEALKERFAGRYGVLKPAMLAIAITAVIGTVDELIQAVLPNRVFDIRDVAFNAFAAVLAVGASVALSFVRNLATSRQKA
ncbi:MAG: VanZ family protein [Acidimicrobiia bacterium]